jgi:CRP-like cAMP-binding protein
MEKVIGLSERKTYRAGDFMFKQDEEADRLFLVEKGLVGIIIQATSTMQVTVCTESR